ncbi:MAG: ABC transporter permease [Clostridiaceae bacterium]|nr:ABC transporter permease [Clostridiaceae bacterium]
MQKSGNKVLGEKLKYFFSQQEIIVVILILIIGLFLCFARPDSFPTTLNLFNILKQASQYAILAVGMGLVIIAGGIDLSVGSNIACGICLAAYINEKAGGISPFLVLLLIFIVGFVFGLINGILIAKVGLPPFIATMGMLSVGEGVALLLSNGSPIKYGESWISVFGGGYLGPVPVQVIVMAVVVILAWIFTKYTVVGRNIYAVGNNPRAASLTGINTSRISILVYVICGLMCSLVGLIMMGQLKQAGPSYGSGYELDAIAAAVIGGISMSGGEGRIFGVTVGAILMALLRNLFVQIAVPGYWQTVVLGLVIIASVSVDALRKHRR